MISNHASEHSTFPNFSNMFFNVDAHAFGPKIYNNFLTLHRGNMEMMGQMNTVLSSFSSQISQANQNFTKKFWQKLYLNGMSQAKDEKVRIEDLKNLHQEAVEHFRQANNAVNQVTHCLLDVCSNHFDKLCQYRESFDHTMHGKSTHDDTSHHHMQTAEHHVSTEN